LDGTGGAAAEKYFFYKMKYIKKPTGLITPEEQGGMRQHRHCPPAKHRVDRNLKYHEE
jgi:hypothetical protein